MFLQRFCSSSIAISRARFYASSTKTAVTKTKSPTAVFTTAHSITESMHMSRRQSVRQFNTTQNQGLVPNMGKNDIVESGALRYLLVSNGWEIHCLDLHAREFLYPGSVSISANTQLLPIIATLNLLEENLPAPVGLFKWRSNVLLIGGMKLPKALKEGGYKFGETKKGIKLYHSLCRSDKGKDTPCLIYGLSLDDASTSLSYSESSNMGKLKKPKTCPIVEEINGQIHVIERRSISGNYCIPSHEVFDRDNRCWVEEIPMLEHFPIDSYSVIAQKVYAVSISVATITGNRDYRSYLVFDSREKKWDVVNSKAQHRRVFRNVWDIIEKVKVVKCVGGFPYGDASDPLYVLIGLDTNDNFDDGTSAVAFLVNSKGLILCIQPLLHFFKCVHTIITGQIIKVEEEDKKKTMCSVIAGCPMDCFGNYVCINIFSVEELPDAAYKVRQVAPKGSDDPVELEFDPVELEFVRVDAIDKHVYRVDPGGGGRAFDWNDLQACLL